MSGLRTLQSLLETLPECGYRPVLLALHKEDTEHWSYAGLADHARRLARGLVEREVGREDHVALLAANRSEWIMACLAVIGAGAVIVPLDAQIGDKMLRNALEDSGAKLVFTTGEGAGRIEGLEMEAALELVLLDT